MSIDTKANILDVRDLHARAEELETEAAELLDLDTAELSDETEGELRERGHLDLADEIEELREVLGELRGYGGDEQWRGDWYPVTLILDSYFEDHARELAEDCGMVTPHARWPNNCIDWEEAADQLKQDYTSIIIRGVTYWYR